MDLAFRSNARRNRDRNAKSATPGVIDGASAEVVTLRPNRAFLPTEPQEGSGEPVSGSRASVNAPIGAMGAVPHQARGCRNGSRAHHLGRDGNTAGPADEKNPLGRVCVCRAERASLKVNVDMDHSGPRGNRAHLESGV